MKLLKFALFLAFIATTYGQEDLGFFRDAAYPGTCVFDNLVLWPGQERRPKGQCTLFLCRNAEGLGEIQGCGATIVAPPCRVGDFKYPNDPYPACCDRHILCD